MTAFAVKGVVPIRGRTNVVPRDGVYASADGGLCACVIGVVLWGEPAVDDLWRDAARILEVPVDVVSGIVYGYDGVAATGIDGTRGPDIGNEVARRVLP